MADGQKGFLFVNSPKMNNADAAAYCEGHGGTLATMKTLEEYNFVMAMGTANH